MRYKNLLSVFLVLAHMVAFCNSNNDTIITKDVSFVNQKILPPKYIYDLLEANKLSYDVFEKAYNGFVYLQDNNQVKKNVLTIIDYDLSSTERRLWVIDLDSIRVIINDWVAHGKNSGGNFANSFSNTPDSFKSSIGFFTTSETYYGKHGLSLYINGIEEGINDNARERYIVIHGADYVSKDFIDKYGRLGRSLGCPAVPHTSCKKIINTIKNKSCIYINGNSNSYTSLLNRGI